jgi:hypothetical protein
MHLAVESAGTDIRVQTGVTMSKKPTLVAIAAALLLSGCASMRGAQDIVCERFDEFAVAPNQSPFVADIQRYAVAKRSDAARDEAIRAGASDAMGAGAESMVLTAAPGESDGSIGDLVAETAFGMDDAALAAEGQRMQSEYDAKSRIRPRSQPVRMPGAESMELPAANNEIVVAARIPTRNVLLLSGGGQWGAYGAGLFLGMACQQKLSPADDRNAIPCVRRTFDSRGREISRTIDDTLINFKRLDDMKIGMITGVSTGGLQSILLMAVLDRTQLKETRVAALQQLITSYAPNSESDLVDHDGFLAVLFQGSVAGTDKLRSHVAEVLEKPFDFRDQLFDEQGRPIGYTPTEKRRLVDQIARSPITTLVGIVEGGDGEFKYVNMKRMVGALPEKGQEATDCVLATTLASSAMPVFHQQLRVIKADDPERGDQPSARTLFDGGVRRSVFISELGDAFKRRYFALSGVMSVEAFAAARRSDTLPKLYVLRNGPTTSVIDTEIDKVDNAQTQALRAYSLLVNELEVGSIAALRLANPYGPIAISTADGSESDEHASNGPGGTPRKACTKKGEMFSPAFMRCLQNFGVRRGMGIELDGHDQPQPIPAFWPLSEIDQRPGIVVPPPANDN